LFRLKAISGSSAITGITAYLRQQRQACVRA
jgi:hypothetical protein